MNPNETPPPAAVLQLMMGSWVSQAAGTVARLRVCDHVGPDGAASVEIAAKLGVNADALARLMRAGAMIGIFKAIGARRYALTAVGELLRTDNPRSMRALLDAETAPGHWLPWARLDDCVRAGHSMAAEVLGMDTWAYYAKHPDEGRTFSEGMSGLSAAAIGAIAEAWQVPAAKTVVDVGGAQGAFLGFVLGKLPEARGVLFELPSVETATPPPRTERVAGDFFKGVPEGGDLYLVKHIIHDWDDASVTAILRNIRRAMAKDATVAIVEMLIPEDGSPSPAILLDLNMLVMLPGRERTAGEIAALLASADLAVSRVIPTHSPFSVIEARAR